MEMELRRILARNLAARLNVKLADRVGIPRREVIVKETVSEKALRVMLDCEYITGEIHAIKPRKG